MGRILGVIFLLLSLGLHAQLEEDVESRFSDRPSATRVEKRGMDSSVVSRIEKEEDYWYANYVPEEENETNSSGGSGGDSKLLYYVLIGLLIAAVLYFLSGSNFSIFRKNDGSFPVEDYSSPQEETNLRRELADAERKEDYRQAVRFQYLILLQELHIRGHIVYDKEKPNGAYLSAVRERPFYKQFFQLTRLFEQVFYGGFNLDKEGYALVSSQFKTIRL